MYTKKPGRLVKNSEFNETLRLKAKRKGITVLPLGTKVNFKHPIKDGMVLVRAKGVIHGYSPDISHFLNGTFNYQKRIGYDVRVVPSQKGSSIYRGVPRSWVLGIRK